MPHPGERRNVTPSRDDWEDLWTLASEELALLAGMAGPGRLGCAVQLKFMQARGRFPSVAKCRTRAAWPPLPPNAALRRTPYPSMAISAAKASGTLALNVGE
jgi:hypothetical protein